MNHADTKCHECENSYRCPYDNYFINDDCPIVIMDVVRGSDECGWIKQAAGSYDYCVSFIRSLPESYWGEYALMYKSGRLASYVL